MPSYGLCNLFYKENFVGKVFHSSKIHYQWEFTSNCVDHKIELIDSRLSTKKVILINGKVQYKGEGHEYITKTFELGGHTIVLIPYGDRYELRLDGSPFKHLMMTQDNQRNFNSTTNVLAYKDKEEDDEADDKEEEEEDKDKDFKIKAPSHKAQSNKNTKQLFNFDIQQKVLKEKSLLENYFFNDLEPIKTKPSHFSQMPKQNNNLLDLDFTNQSKPQPQSINHPHSSNSLNFNILENVTYSPYPSLDINTNTNTNNHFNPNYNLNTIPYQIPSHPMPHYHSNNNFTNLNLNPVQNKQTMIDFFD